MAKNKNPIISVVVPAYNEEKLIGPCLASLVTQKFDKEYEIIVIDNCSTDKTVQIAKKYPVRIIKEKNKGVIFAKQCGLLNADANIVAFLDADSQASPLWLKTIYDSLNSSSAIVAVTGPYEVNDGPIFNQKFAQIYQKFYKSYFYIFGKTIYLAGGNFACKKSIAKKFGGFDVTKGVGEDEFGILSKLKMQGHVLYEPSLKIVTSGRRASGGFIKFCDQFIFGYFFNFLSIRIFGKKLFRDYTDIR